MTSRTHPAARTALAALLFAAVLLVPASPGRAETVTDTIVSNGTISLGINDTGNLIAGPPSEAVGLRFDRNGHDAITPGCLCEGWGVADRTSAVSGWAGRNDGVSNVTVESFEVTSAFVRSIVLVGPTYRVTHTYRSSPATSNLFEALVEIENLSDADVNTRYRRVLDWDVPPSEFEEHVSSFGSSRLLGEVTNNGFATLDPLDEASDRGARGNFTDFGPADQGISIDVEVVQPPGDTAEFLLFFGAAPSELTAQRAVTAASMEYHSLAQPTDEDGAPTGIPNTFIFGMRNAGFSVVPDEFLRVVGEDASYELLVPADVAAENIGIGANVVSGRNDGDALRCTLLFGLIDSLCFTQAATEMWVTYGSKEAGYDEIGVFLDIDGNGRADATEPIDAVSQLWIEPTSLVAMGDSYTAGDGAGAYVSGAAAPASCNVSRNGFPHLMTVPGRQDESVVKAAARQPDDDVMFDVIACSGATTSQMLAGGRGQAGRPAQMDQGAITAGTDVVVLTAGGNDLGFGTLAQSCLLSRCLGATDPALSGLTPEDWITARLPGVRSDIETLLTQIRGAAPNATIFLVGYPRLFPSDPAGQRCVELGESAFFGTLEADEQDFFNETSARLNAQLEEAAAAKDAEFIDAARIFTGHELRSLIRGDDTCAANTSWINGVIGSSSLHPNAAGHAAIADAIRLETLSRYLSGIDTNLAGWPASDDLPADQNLGQRIADDQAAGAATDAAARSVRRDAGPRDEARVEPAAVDPEAIPVLTHLQVRPLGTPGCSQHAIGGSNLDVAASGFAPGSAVEFFARRDGEAAFPLSTATADDDGAVAETLRLPVETSILRLTAVGETTDEALITAMAVFSVGDTGPDCDLVAPTGTIDAPDDGATYAALADVEATFACADDDEVASCRGTNVVGDPVDTRPGFHAFHVDASDLSGNSTRTTATYQAGTWVAATGPTNVDSDATGATYVITRSGGDGTAEPVEVTLEYGGSASTFGPANVTIPAGDTTVEITVTFDTGGALGERTATVRPRVRGFAFSTVDSTARTTIAAGVPAGGDEDRTTRVFGTTRTATAARVSAVTFPDGGSDTVVLARSDQYPDALAGAPLAKALGGPILLTSPSGLSDDARLEIDRLGATHAVLLGGIGALSESVREDVENEGLTTERIAGDNRFETAGRIADRVVSEAGTPSGSGTVYVVEGSNADPSRGWPDALAAAPLAAFADVPILLVTRDAVPTATRATLERLRPADAVIVGGQAAVSDSVATDIRGAGVSVFRSSGASRYDTARVVAEFARAQGMSESTLWVATGVAFPDALVAGPAVGAAGDLLLLVHPNDLSRSPAATEFITEHRTTITRIRVLGGPGAVSDEVVDQLDALLDP